MSEVDRVVGIESEYGLSYAFSQEQLDRRAAEGLPRQIWGANADPAFKAFKLYLPAELGRSAVCPAFLTNGMRLYRDIGDHPEAAGAETTDIDELVIGDAAGDRLVWRALRDAYKAGAIQNFMLSRRTIDQHGTTWGRHENYRVSRATVTTDNNMASDRKMQPLAPFLAVRPLTGGAGCLHKGEFWMGQKIITVVDDINNQTTHTKPLVNNRNEPLGTGFRQHVVPVDFTSPHVTARNFGMTSAVLRLMEHRAAPHLHITGGVANWAFFAKRAALDMSLTYAAEVNGKTMTALNVHEEYLERAENLDADAFSPAEQRGLQKWNAIYKRLKAVQIAAGKGDRRERAERIEHAIGEHLAGYIDWADRLLAIPAWQSASQKWQPDGVTFVNHTATAAKTDIDYDLVGTGGGLSRTYLNRLRAPEAAEWANEACIEHRILHAPAVGRAALREKFLREFMGDPGVAAGWDYVGYQFAEYGNHTMHTHYLKEPTASEDAGLDSFMASVKRAQPKSMALRARIEEERQRRAL